MSKINRLAAVAVALFVIAAVAAPALAAEATVGRFIQELAKVKNLNATDPAIAADSLRGVGVRLPAKLEFDKKLTERDVADISRRVGLLVTTSNPGAYFSEQKVDRFFQSFSTELTSPIGSGSGAFVTTECDPAVENCDNPGQGEGPGTGNGNGPPFDPFAKGRGKKKGKAKQARTPTDPE